MVRKQRNDLGGLLRRGGQLPHSRLHQNAEHGAAQRRFEPVQRIIGINEDEDATLGHFHDAYEQREC